MPRQFLVLAGVALLPLVLASRPIPAETRKEASSSLKSPLGLAVDEKGEKAYVALHTAGAVAVVDLKAGKVLHEISVGPGAIDAAVDKGTLYIAYEGSEDLAAINLSKPTIRRQLWFKAAPPEVASRLDPSRRRASAPLGASNVRDRAESGFAEILIHQRPKNAVSATQIAQGWVFSNAATLRYLFGGSKLAILDEPNQGHADPSAIVVTPDRKYVFITCAGADTLLVLDWERLAKYQGKQSTSYDGGDFGSDDLTASRHYVIAKLPTQANPRRLALSGDGKTLVVSNYLGDSLTVIDAVNLKVVKHISLGDAKPDAVRRGEVLFNSAKMTFQGQFTCASCHPNGGSDGLTWDLERDGVGNFKKTKSLLGVKDTAPYGWHGSSATLADRVAGTLRTLHRHEPTEAEVNDLVAYLESLPPPQPLPQKEEDKPAITRGQKLFQGKGQCASCHNRTALDDGKTHDIGTRGETDTQDRFDTPALRGVARNAPYLHDGRAATLEEVFSKHNPKQRHGAAHLLGKEELADLIAYLKSL